MRVRFTRETARQLASLHRYIAMQSYEERADRYVERIVDFCKGLESFPRRGTQRDDILPGLRTVAFERRVTVAFMITEAEVLIEGVFYAGRQLGPD